MRGYPIRKPTDQSVFAAPRGLSQLTASFIACRCQGIRRAPVYACPEIDSRYTLQSYSQTVQIVKDRTARSARKMRQALPPAPPTGLVGVPGVEPGTSSLSGTRSNQLSYTPVAWWRRPGSNRRHPACKAGALPTELRPRWGTRRRCRRARMFMIGLSRARSVQKGCDPETLIPLSGKPDFTVAPRVAARAAP